jgi:2-methylisocitrate lyase-like PEP mutase family enzyme
MDDVRHGIRLREALSSRDITPLIGVYDVFSATVAARYYDGIFVSGFGFAASHYGLPDIGFITWTDMLAFVERLRCVLPWHHMLVDIDDGYCDTEVACHVVSRLEQLGASGVVLEDQKRPRRCGHFGGKQLLDMDEYLDKLERVLDTRRELVVIARTDATDPSDIDRRVRAFAAAGADAVLVDGLTDLELIPQLRRNIDTPMVFNQIAGGKSPPVNLSRLRELGIGLAIYSTPCLFAAQAAIADAMSELVENDGQLPAVSDGRIGVAACTDVLRENLTRREQSLGAPQFDGTKTRRSAA